MEGAGQVILRLGTIGLRIFRDMKLPSEPGQVDVGDTSFSHDVKELLKKVELTDDAPQIIPRDDTLRMANWLEWAVGKGREVDSFNAALIPYLPFLETELISKINKVVLSNFVFAARMMAEVPFSHGDLSMLFSDSLPDFLIACEDLRVYSEVISLKVDQTLGL